MSKGGTVQIVRTGPFQLVRVMEGGASGLVRVMETSAPKLVRVITEGPPGPPGEPAPPTTRGITIAAPQGGDSFTLFRTAGQTTISSVVGLVSGGSVSYELHAGSDRSQVGTVIAGGTVTDTMTGDSATVGHQPIPAGCYVWVEIQAVEGSVAEFNLSIGA